MRDYRTRTLACLLLTTVVSALLAVPRAAMGQDVGDQLLKSFADDPGTEDRLGLSVASSAGRILAGAPGKSAIYIFDAVTGDQQLKVQGATAFGRSVDAEGTVGIVGDPFSDDHSGGAAYLIDLTTGQVLHTLVASDADPHDNFGWSVALSGGVAIVGAYNAGVIDPTGAAYLFDVATGQQLFKLTPSDLEVFDEFGLSVAIEGGLAVVGGDTSGIGVGKAYVFDVATGTQLHKLDPSDGQISDRFGDAVAISGTTVLVGSPRHFIGGQSKGAVYVFDAQTGQQIDKLTAEPGVLGDQFGTSIAADGNLALIGTEGTDGAGTAYLFDLGSRDQIVVLTGDDGAAGNKFGAAVALASGKAIVGDYNDSDRAFRAGAVFVFKAADVDTDGDGLLDSWETVGIPYTDQNGDEQRYVLDVDGDGISDADPNRKDLFVEVDIMDTVSFPLDAKLDVEFAFATAPVSNPDGTEGITLHIVRDDDDLAFEEETGSNSGQFPPLAGVLKTNHFGTAAERARDDRFLLLEAKVKAYRYCLVFNQSSRTIGGHAELGGDDMILYVGGMSTEERAAVLMHELGHCLDLGHGGGDSINGKPNYISVMNYTLAYREPWNRTFWTLDYSRSQLATIAEDSITELVSVGAGGGGLYDDYFMPFFGVVPNGSPCFPPELWGEPVISYADMDPAVLTDLNLDCDTDDEGFAGDLNYLDGSNLPGSQDSPTPGEVLVGHDDWANIVLPISAGGGPFAGRLPSDELTTEQREFMRDNFPPPPTDCLADWNGDGLVDTRDVLAFLNAWNDRDPESDVNGDGYIDTRDVLAFLNAWTVGC